MYIYEVDRIIFIYEMAQYSVLSICHCELAGGFDCLAQDWFL